MMTYIGPTEERWINLWARLGVTKRHWVRSQYRALRARYGESHRAHHRLVHIRDGLELLWTHRHLAVDPDAVEMAWFFHDVIYHTHVPKTHAPCNEKLSGRFADGMMFRGGLTTEFRRTVLFLIHATIHREEFVKTSDQKLIADIDWSILGMPWQNYFVYVANIRKEYKEYSDQEFLKGRTAWIVSAQSSRLFYLDEFKAIFNEQAKNNLLSELSFYKGADFAKLWELL